MRVTALAIAALASLVSAAPISTQPESSPNDNAVLLPRSATCTNYPGVIAGHYVPSKRSLPTRSTIETPSLLPRDPTTDLAPRINWCRSHSDLWLFFYPGSRPLLGGAANTASLLTTILHNINANYIGKGLGGHRVGDTWIWLGSVGGEGVYVKENGANGLTWSVAETGVKVLQNYVAVRKDYTSVTATVSVRGKELGKVILGGPQPA